MGHLVAFVEGISSTASNARYEGHWVAGTVVNVLRPTFMARERDFLPLCGYKFTGVKFRPIACMSSARHTYPRAKCAFRTCSTTCCQALLYHSFQHILCVYSNSKTMSQALAGFCKCSDKPGRNLVVCIDGAYTQLGASVRLWWSCYYRPLLNCRIFFFSFGVSTEHPCLWHVQQVLEDGACKTVDVLQWWDECGLGVDNVAVQELCGCLWLVSLHWHEVRAFADTGDGLLGTIRV